MVMIMRMMDGGEGVDVHFDVYDIFWVLWAMLYDEVEITRKSTHRCGRDTCITCFACITRITCKTCIICISILASPNYLHYLIYLYYLRYLY